MKLANTQGGQFKFSSIEAALFALYNYRFCSLFKSTDFSKDCESSNSKSSESEIPNEKRIFAGTLIFEIEKMCDPVDLLFLQVFYGYVDIRAKDYPNVFTGNELLKLCELIKPRCAKVCELVFLAYRNPHAQYEDNQLYQKVMAISGLTIKSAESKVYDIRVELKKCRNNFNNTEHELAHKIERLLIQNDVYKITIHPPQQPFCRFNTMALGTGV